ncbi:MAG: hypothetical protein WDN06_08795 [Asticcacaulis sp.]
MTETTQRIDLPTVAGIAALAYVLTTLCHEGLGHGGACVLVGGHPTAWGAYYFDCDEDGLPSLAGRIVAAAGSTVNLILAVILGLNGRRRRQTTGPAWRRIGLPVAVVRGQCLHLGRLLPVLGRRRHRRLGRGRRAQDGVQSADLARRHGHRRHGRLCLADAPGHALARPPYR